MGELLADTLRGQATCTFWPLAVTAAHEVTVNEACGRYVPRKERVSTLQVLQLQTRRLLVDRILLNAPLLVRELENFKAKIAAARAETFETWREGPHDDLVLAVAPAAGLDEKAIPVEVEPPEEDFSATWPIAAW